MLQTKLKATFALFIFTLALAAPAMLGHAAPAPPPAPAVALPDFTISVSPAFATRKRGSGELYNITIQALNGFNGTVNFTVTGLFPGSSQFPVPPPPVTGSGTSSFDILTQHPPNTPQGTFTLTITGTSGSLSHSAQVKLQMV